MSKRRRDYDGRSRPQKRMRPSSKAGILIDDDGDEHLDYNYLSQLNELQRETFIYDFRQKERERKERKQAEQELLQMSGNTGNQIKIKGKSNGNRIRDGDSDDDDDDNITTYNNNNNGGYIHSERMAQISMDNNNNMDNNDDDDDDDDEQERGRSRGQRNSTSGGDTDTDLTCKDLRGVQLKREELEKRLFEPYFNDLIKNLYVRVWIGQRRNSKGGQTHVYRACKIVGTQKYPKAYKLTDKTQTSSVGLVVSFGRSKRVFKITTISDSPINENEFIEWKQQMNKDGLHLPSANDLRDIYLNAVTLIKNFRYDDYAIRNMIRRKQESRKYDIKTMKNIYQFKVDKLNAYKAENDPNERKRLKELIRQLDDEIQNRERKKNSKVSVDHINKINAKKNVEMNRIMRERQVKLRIEKERKRKLKLQRVCVICMYIYGLIICLFGMVL